MALAGRGVVIEGNSLHRTTHARNAREVEEKLSNLLADFRAPGSSSGRQLEAGIFRNGLAMDHHVRDVGVAGSNPATPTNT